MRFGKLGVITSSKEIMSERNALLLVKFLKNTKVYSFND